MELVRTKRTDVLKELMDQRRSLDDALAVIEEYGESTAERYHKFRYNWPRTAEDKRVHAARKAASHFWQTAERCSRHMPWLHAASPCHPSVDAMCCIQAHTVLARLCRALVLAQRRNPL